MSRIGYSRHDAWVETVTTRQEYGEDSSRVEYQPECSCGWVGRSVIACDEYGNYADKDVTAFQEARETANEHEGEYI